MANSIKSDDINYQPRVKGYSYSTPNDIISNKVKPKIKLFKNFFIKNLSTFITLIIAMVFIFLITFSVILVLNYYRVISLYKLNAGLFSGLPVKLIQSSSGGGAHENNLNEIRR